MKADKGHVSQKKAFIFFLSRFLYLYTECVKRGHKACLPTYSISLEFLITFFLLNPTDQPLSRKNIKKVLKITISQTLTTLKRVKRWQFNT